jgi:hypothetical protein
MLLFVVPTLLGFGLMAGAMKWGAESASQAQRDIHVLNHRMTAEGGQRFIVGGVQNRSTNRTYDLVGVEFYLYDKAGKELPEAASAETHGLKPGAVWRLKAPVRDRRAVRYVLGTVRYGANGWTGSRSYHSSRFKNEEKKKRAGGGAGEFR